MNARDSDVSLGDIKGTAEKIMNYLLRNPTASDTVEGISHWWLVDENSSPAVVESALDLLLQKKKVLSCERSSGEIYYALNKT